MTTPGPWKIAAGLQSFPANRLVDMYPISSQFLGVAYVATSEDARLIAAAPDLADALRAMVDNYIDAYGDEGDDLPASVKAARAALAKVES